MQWPQHTCIRCAWVSCGSSRAVVVVVDIFVYFQCVINKLSTIVLVSSIIICGSCHGSSHALLDYKTLLHSIYRFMLCLLLLCLHWHELIGLLEFLGHCQRRRTWSHFHWKIVWMPLWWEVLLLLLLLLLKEWILLELLWHWNSFNPYWRSRRRSMLERLVLLLIIIIRKLNTILMHLHWWTQLLLQCLPLLLRLLLSYHILLLRYR